MQRLSVSWAFLSLAVLACGGDDDDDDGDGDGTVADAAPSTPDAGVQADAAAADAAPTADCSPALPLEPGQATFTLTSGGIERSYVMHVPKGYEGDTAVPVVLDFHGSGSNPAQELAISEITASADAAGFLVVAPVAVVPNPGGGFTWNVPVDPKAADDVQFTSDVIADVATRACADRKRVYASGYSGGGRLASLLACTLSDEIAAVSTVGGIRFTDPCEQDRPVPILAFHGTADAINPYEGGGPPYWGDSVEDALSDWAEHLECEGKRVDAEVSKNVDSLSFSECDGDSELVLYRVDGGGHTWPGTAFPFPAEPFGTVTQEISATDLQTQFFARFSLP